MNRPEDEITVSLLSGVQLPANSERPVSASAQEVASERIKSPERLDGVQTARWKNNMHPSGLRRVTERRLAHLLMRSESLSRIELSQQAGLSLTAVGKIINSLVANQVVEKVKVQNDDAMTGPTLGRPSEYFRIARSRIRYLVVELGVNKTIVAGLPIAGPVGDIRTAHFRTPSTLEVFEARLKAAIGALEFDDPIAILVSVPGVVDEDKPHVLYSPNLHWTEGDQLFAAIRRVLPADLVVVQEIRALALGYLLNSDPHDSFLLVDMGDGVGGAMVIEGHLQYGPLPLSAEIGHTPIPDNERKCGCGSVGCLETLVGRRGLLKSARDDKTLDAGTWPKLVAALENEPLPEWMSATLDATARVIAGALNSMGVAKVVLTGDLPEIGPGIVQHIAEGVNKHALWGRFGNISVTAASRQRLLGLALAALDRVVLAPTPTEESLGRHVRELNAI